jgi:hypothetical protein
MHNNNSSQSDKTKNFLPLVLMAPAVVLSLSQQQQKATLLKNKFEKKKSVSKIIHDDSCVFDGVASAFASSPVISLTPNKNNKSEKENPSTNKRTSTPSECRENIVDLNLQF